MFGTILCPPIHLEKFGINSIIENEGRLDYQEKRPSNFFEILLIPDTINIIKYVIRTCSIITLTEMCYVTQDVFNRLEAFKGLSSN